MYRLGMPVPPAFIITADCCIEYFKQQEKEGKEKDGGVGSMEVVREGSKLEHQLLMDCKKAVHELEMQTGKVFGGDLTATSPKNPLLLSVRSGAAVSMPGVMDTVLNLGINEEITNFLARTSGNPWWAFDSYRRFLQMFGDVVLGVGKRRYEEILEAARIKCSVAHDSLLPLPALKEVVAQFKALAEVPEDPWQQLQMAIEAVFRSWYSPRAVKYRDINGIAGDLGTAVTVQSMVYGNMNTKSGSGVAFTRNPATGQKELYGEFLFNAEVREGLGSARGEVVRRKL